MLPIESEITPGGKKAEIIATGRLGDIAKEAVKNVSATIQKHFGEDIKEKYDIFVQFLQTASQHGGVEGEWPLYGGCHGLPAARNQRRPTS